MKIDLTKRELEVIIEWLGELDGSDIDNITDKYNLDLELVEIGDALLNLYGQLSDELEREL